MKLIYAQTSIKHLDIIKLRIIFRLSRDATYAA